MTNRLTHDELLKPRFKVMKDWPGRKDFEVGQIILLDKVFCNGSPMCEIEDCQGKRTYIMAFFEMFTQEFKLVAWWEERKEWEMPEYVKGEDGNIYKVRYYEQYNFLWMESKTKEKVSTWAVNDKVMCFFEPTTETEYLNYIKQKA